MAFPVTDCVNDENYIPPDLCNSLGCTKSVKQVYYSNYDIPIAGTHHLEEGI